MTGTFRGRRQPLGRPANFSGQNWATARKAVAELFEYLQGAFDGLPAPHADTHLLGSDDPLQDPEAPSTIEAGDVSEAGDGPSFAAEDHVHGVATGVPVALGTALAEGTSTSLARSDHVHARAVEVLKAAAGVGIRRALNFVDTATATITATDDAGNNRVDVSVSTTGASSVVTPAQLVADTNNWAPAAGEIVRLSTDAARNITGLVAGASGARRLLVNVGGFNATLKHADGASTAANQFLANTGADIVLAPNAAAMAWYDATTARWRVYLI